MRFLFVLDLWLPARFRVAGLNLGAARCRPTENPADPTTHQHNYLEVPQLQVEIQIGLQE